MTTARIFSNRYCTVRCEWQTPMQALTLRITHVPHHGSVCEKGHIHSVPLSLSWCSWGPRTEQFFHFWFLLFTACIFTRPSLSQKYTLTDHLTTSDPLSVVSTFFLYWKLLEHLILPQKADWGSCQDSKVSHIPTQGLGTQARSRAFPPPTPPLSPYFLPETLLASLCSQTYTKHVDPPCFTPANLSACAGYVLYPPLLHPVFTSDMRDVFSSHSI